jgi:hypothetical protein
MEHVSPSHGPSVVVFPSVPRPESLAICKHRRGYYLLRILRECAEAGCDTCRLRHIGILRVYGLPDNSGIIEIHTYDSPPGTEVVEYRPNGTVVACMFIQLYTRAGETKSLWPIVGVGRELDDRRRGYASIVAEWLRTCRDDHPICPPIADVPLPTRLLDVGPSVSNSIRLLVTAGQKGSYIALSHCWVAVSKCGRQRTALRIGRDRFSIRSCQEASKMR